MQYWLNSVLLTHNQAFDVFIEAAQTKGYTRDDAQVLWSRRGRLPARKEIFQIMDGQLLLLYFLDCDVEDGE